jgi:branched-chain amino acid transport system substrate-binding protein
LRARAIWLIPLSLALGAAGCGGGQAVGEGATATVYAADGACAAAKRELAGAGGAAGRLRLRLSCLPPVRREGRLDLGRIGANARRAVEDSTTVGYIGELEPAATRFSETILDEADIAQLSGMGGEAAMRRLLRAIEEADLEAGGLREQVRDALGP